MPSMRISTWFDSLPRMRTLVRPALPDTATPGTSRSTSATCRTWRSSSWALSMTVALPPRSAADTPPGARVAVTMIVSGVSCARATAAAASATKVRYDLYTSVVPGAGATRPGLRAWRGRTSARAAPEARDSVRGGPAACRSDVSAPRPALGPGQSDPRRPVSWLAGHRSPPAFPEARGPPVVASPQGRGVGRSLAAHSC